MKIILFGSNGMLGTYLNSYLSIKHEVVPLTRKDYDLSANNMDESSLFHFLKEVVNDGDVIINAAGIIKQREHNINDMIMVNSLFPNFLAKFKTLVNCNVIHITSDSVFSGRDGGYDETAKHDCVDYYGQSKSLGEHPQLTSIRTSTIGEEKNNRKSILEWVRSNSGKTISGYLNHKWNGVTCLQLSKIINSIIDYKIYWDGVRHIHSPNTVSKIELCGMINDVYKLGITIEGVETPENCFRDLSTINKKFDIPTLREQIMEMNKYKI